MRSIHPGASVLLIIGLLLGCTDRSSPSFNSSSGSAHSFPSKTPVTDTSLAVNPAPSSQSPAFDKGSSDSLDLPETNYYEIRVPQGRMVLRLYDETPHHRDNFKKLVEEGYYDGTTFHRVIEGFMIQGGDPNSRDRDPYNDGLGDPGYTLPAEIVPHFFHKRGAVAAARTGDAVNPDRRSSGSQFYVVQGAVVDETPLDQIERRIRMTQGMEAFAFSDTVRRIYGEVGGAPNLDGQYTIFGEIVEGMDVLDAVASVPTPRKVGQRSSPQISDRPLEDVAMTVEPLPDYSP